MINLLKKVFFRQRYTVNAHTWIKIQILNELNEKAKFSHFANLRSGHDSFSKLSLTELKNIVNDETVKIIQCYLFDELLQSKALRWYLRGLKINLAIRKALVDQEIFFCR